MKIKYIISILLIVCSQASAAEFTTLPTQGARPAWSPDGKWIYFDWKDESGKFKIYRIHPDGTDKECLTCGRPDVPGHSGAARVHPSGRYLVFTIEKKHPGVARKGSSGNISGPGAGIFNDVAVLDLKDSKIYNLTDVRTDISRPGGSLFPKFSHDGKRIAWADYENRGSAKSRFGNWRIAVGEFVSSPTPHLENIQYLDPVTDSIYEIQGWTHDNSGIYSASKTYAEQDGYTLDFCQIDLKTGNLVSLTRTSGLHGEPAEFEEHGKISANGKVIAFMGSQPHGVRTDKNFLTWLRTDLWTMRPDGSNKKKITNFNDSRKRVMVSEMDFSPDAKKVVARVYYVNKELTTKDDYSALMIIPISDSDN